MAVRCVANSNHDQSIRIFSVLKLAKFKFSLFSFPQRDFDDAVGTAAEAAAVVPEVVFLSGGAVADIYTVFGDCPKIKFCPNAVLRFPVIRI
jgi:hypothetical protein